MNGPLVTKEMMIGEVMEEYPETIDVFKRHFGKGCFDCPGSNNEDIEFGTLMHNADLETVLKELNETAERQLKRDGKR